MNGESFWGLLILAERLAALAVRRFQTRYARLGLLALTIEGFANDPRENLQVLAVLHDAIRRTGGDADAIFREWAGHVNPDVGTHFIEFSRRKAPLKSLSAMGYHASADAFGEFRYSRGPK